MKKYLKHIGVFVLAMILNSCQDFLDVELPKNEIDQKLVFSDDRMAVSAMTNIYSKVRDLGFFTGNKIGIGYLFGCYTDELEATNLNESNFLRFYQNSVQSNNNAVGFLWNDTYNQIYNLNNVLEGLEKSEAVSKDLNEQLQGEALTLRGVLHFYLTQTYGSIPYVTSTDYKKNTTISKQSVQASITQAIDDLTKAEQVLSHVYPSTEKVRINKSVVEGFLARIYLYQNNWEMAQHYAEKLINNNSFRLESLETLFLKESKSAIWQLKPEVEGKSTLEATEYQFEILPPPFVRLSSSLLADFEQGDLRKKHWVKFVGNDALNACAFKYKIKESSSSSREYSIILRLEEMYLIAAEVSAEKREWSEFNEYINAIRSRAGLSLLNIDNYQDAIQAIKQERRIEFFCEFGHRFYDLKRWNFLSEMVMIKPQWQKHHELLPLPEKELLLNPKLLPQNIGY